jgi:glycosyltransferase involved in cell wall biosynthesis
MRILITIPGFKPCGGIRVICEWINRLPGEVYVYSLKPGRPDWISTKGRWVYSVPKELFDLAIFCDPVTYRIHTQVKAVKKFVFCQMADYLFNEKDTNGYSYCRNFYTSPYPMLSISLWNIDLFKSKFGRKSETYLIGNGVNLVDFPISNKKKDGNIILVEGWEARNESKDSKAIAPKVCARLKDEGYTIWAFSQSPLITMPDVVDRYIQYPNLKQMNEMYEQATILIKASKYDARSCSPMEAMTKGTVTARAAINADDDLIHEVNSLRCDYDEESLFLISKRLLEDYELRQRLANNCIKYVQKYTWDYWMKEIEKIITVKTLILGAGKRERIKDAKHQDQFAFDGIDYVFNLNDKKWPLKEKFDRVIANHVVEHLQSLINFMDNCHSLLNPTGILELDMPNAGMNPDLEWCDPTHVRMYRPHTFTNYFTKFGIDKFGYTDKEWEILKLETFKIDPRMGQNNDCIRVKLKPVK